MTSLSTTGQRTDRLRHQTLECASLNDGSPWKKLKAPPLNYGNIDSTETRLLEKI
jgi:hypothetical protein